MQTNLSLPAAEKSGYGNDPNQYRSQREQKHKPIYVAESMVFGQRLPKSQPKLLKKLGEPIAIPGRCWAKKRRSCSGDSMRMRSHAPPGGSDLRCCGPKLASEPLLRASRVAEDWGWKMCLEQGMPLCPLYYGCPMPSDYFCCERHSELWEAGVLEMERMPASLMISAPDPPWAREFLGGGRIGDGTAAWNLAPAASGKRLCHRQVVRGMAMAAAEGSNSESRGSWRMSR